MFNSPYQHVTQTLLLSTGSTDKTTRKSTTRNKNLHKNALTSPRRQPLRPHTHIWNRTQEPPRLCNSCSIRHTRRGTPHTPPHASIPDAKKGSFQSDRNHLRMLDLSICAYRWTDNCQFLANSTQIEHSTLNSSKSTTDIWLYFISCKAWVSIPMQLWLNILTPSSNLIAWYLQDNHNKTVRPTQYLYLPWFTV